MSWGKGVSKSHLHSYRLQIAGGEALRWLLLTCHHPACPQTQGTSAACRSCAFRGKGIRQVKLDLAVV